MKFKSGDLVKIDSHTLAMRLIDDKWAPDASCKIGVVLSALNGTANMRDEDFESILMYEVLVDGRIERRIESALEISE